MPEDTEPRRGKLVSKLDHPASALYEGKGILISPREIIENVQEDKLGRLPGGVFFVPNKKE